jgi:riboflavin kinase/FMN adenylyltransferase
MRVVSGYRRLAANTAPSPSAIGIGIFDGVHQGHRALLRQVVDLASAEGLVPTAYTFDPHPATLFRPELAPQMIEPLAVRLERLAALGIACTVVEPFDRTFAATTADAYVETILDAALGARHVVVGRGFVFGHQQRGNVALLQAMGVKHGFKAHPVDHVRFEGIEVSSTKVRALVQAGQVAGAHVLLTRPFMLTGTVVSGDRRGGSQLGFPTANMRPDNVLLPALGVYAAQAEGQFGTQAAVVNVGYNPTFGEGTQLKIEAHLPDYAGPDFYDTTFRLHFIDRIRDEMRFDGLEALMAQIQADIGAARTILARQSTV